MVAPPRHRRLHIVCCVSRIVLNDAQHFLSSLDIVLNLSHVVLEGLDALLLD